MGRDLRRHEGHGGRQRRHDNEAAAAERLRTRAPAHQMSTSGAGHDLPVACSPSRFLMVAPSLPSRAPAAPASNALVRVPDLGLSLPLLLDVPDAGALAGMSRWASYRAATDGTIPTLKVGNRLRVPT